MSNTYVNILEKYANSVLLNELPLTRDTFSSCYYFVLSKNNQSETEEISEKWIDYMWCQFQHLSADKLALAMKENRIDNIAMEALGKL